MKVAKIIRAALLLVVATFCALTPKPSVARQGGRPPDCPPLTEEESRRRYPSVDVQPGKVYVFGSVHRPGAFDHKGGLTLSQVIELAGGVLADASMNVRVMVVRAGEPERPAVEVNLKRIAARQAPDMALESGAVVDVESKCAPVVPPVRQPYYDTVPKRRRPPVR